MNTLTAKPDTYYVYDKSPAGLRRAEFRRLTGICVQATKAKRATKHGKGYAAALRAEQAAEAARDAFVASLPTFTQ